MSLTVARRNFRSMNYNKKESGLKKQKTFVANLFANSVEGCLIRYVSINNFVIDCLGLRDPFYTNRCYPFHCVGFNRGEVPDPLKAKRYGAVLHIND